MSRVLVFDEYGNFLMSAYIRDNMNKTIIIKYGGSVYITEDPTIEFYKNLVKRRLGVA